MATKRQMELLAGKALVEPEFRYQLLKNPKKAAESIHIELTKDQIDMIRHLDPEQLEATVNDFQTAFGKERFAWGW